MRMIVGHAQQRYPPIFTPASDPRNVNNRSDKTIDKALWDDYSYVIKF